MLISVFIFLLISAGGLLLTYLYDKNSPLLVRFAAGNVIGSVIFSLAAFLAACLVGFSTATVLFALAISLLPLALLTRKEIKLKFAADRNHAKQMSEHANRQKFFNFAYYAVLILIMFLFFERAMLLTKDGIFTGASQNLGDLPFHLGAIFSFTEGNNFPPENPSYAFAKFTYPFMADLVAAGLVKLGAGVRDAMLVQNIFLGFSIVVLLERFVFKLTNSKLAGKFAPLILLFCGGLGFIIFLRDFSDSGKGLTDFLWNLKDDYTIRQKGLRWGNSLVVLFITQRSFLFGLPITLIALTKIWEIFTSESEKIEKPESEEVESINQTSDSQKGDFLTLFRSHFSTFAVGLLAGTLPLIHVHSLMVLFVVCAVLMFFRLDKLKEWIVFGVAVSIVAVPQLIWSLTGSATNLTEFVGWHFGWDARDENFFVFWLKNLGLFIPLLLIALFLVFQSKETEDKAQSQIANRKSQLLIFYIPFALCFIIPNLIKLAPWEWDNIKVLIYWFIGSLPFVAWFLAWLWQKDFALKIVAAACLAALIFSGAIDVWRVISGQINYQVFSPDSVKIAEVIKQRTPPNAMFLNAPTYNSAVVLSGRRSLMRYSGHLGSYGINYFSREEEVKRVYEGTALAESILRKYGIEYIIVSPEEEGNLNSLNKEFFEKFPKFAESGAYKIYKVK